YDDGLRMALWLSSRVGSMNYYVPIPFYKYGSKKPRDNPSKGFNNSYWKDWIDGVLSVVDSNRLGFYWSYESCLQATPNDAAGVSVEFIQKMSNYVHNHGQELIWIPTIGNRAMKWITNSDYVTIPALAEYFDHVFVQPYYYQTTKLDDGNDYTFQDLVSRVEWMLNHGLSIEMEADNSIIGEPSNCAYCKSTQGWWENGTFHEKVGCDETPTPETERQCINRACDYYKALLEVSPSAFSTRAYYFGTDLRVVDKVRGRCQDW
ncbi:DUF4855 domain-containing protein, partial [Thermococcus celericrescens]